MKWSKSYWADLAERVASTAIYGLITLLTANAVTNLTPELGWTIVGLPTILSLLKGLLANLKDPESGASLLPSPPGPEIAPDENGNSAVTILIIVALLLAILWLLGEPVHIG